ncbi:hypothetical protein J5751_06345 [bacterium]|nr:hypothetical protein [bacterium]
MLNLKRFYTLYKNKMVLEQINTDENKENISVNELRDAIKPGGFLDSENKNYEENIKSV